MCPSEGRDVCQQVWGAVEAVAFSACDGLAKMLGVPIDDDGGEQVQPCHAEVLGFGGAVADFTLAANAQGVFQSVMGLTLVQADLGTALHVGIEGPFDDEERPFYPSDFFESFCQRVLAGIGCKFAQNLTGRHDARDHGCGAAQDVGPVGNDDGVECRRVQDRTLSS